MTITYEIGSALYLNITNRCSNRCTFCVRNNTDGVVDGLDLWLDQEPTVDEVLTAIGKQEITKYTEFVFCGYGEPMMRIQDLLQISEKLKEKYFIPIRINTNGQANLIYGQDVTPQLEGWIDAVSISLNAKDKKIYQKICLSDYGEAAFDAVLDFAGKCRQYVPTVILSVVDVMTDEDIQSCREIAERIGVGFKVRQLVE